MDIFKKRTIFYLLAFLIISIGLLQSCQGCSRSGRAKLIAQAKKEAGKKETTPEPHTIIKDVEPEIVEINDIVTPKEKQEIHKELVKKKTPPVQGYLIQTEGLVLVEVSELTIDLGTNGSNVTQILEMNDYVKNNWHYVFDPDIGVDTWRSAEATLALKYKGKYTGDCDDFAILMASFARQVGLESRVVGGFVGNDGHAFAEFLLPNEERNNDLLKGRDYREDYRGIWVSLDWFNGSDHNRYLNNFKVFEDI